MVCASGHGLSALTNSKLVPKATRILADRFDGLWYVNSNLDKLLNISSSVDTSEIYHISCLL